LTSLRDTGGIERAMDYIFFQVAAVNGFDSVSHYLRAGLIVNTCTQYALTNAPDCSANFQDQGTYATAASGSAAKVRSAPAPKATTSDVQPVALKDDNTTGALLDYLMGG
jgi:hypothetical protein